MTEGPSPPDAADDRPRLVTNLRSAEARLAAAPDAAPVVVVPDPPPHAFGPAAAAVLRLAKGANP